MDRGNVQRIGQTLTNACVCSVFVSLGTMWFKSCTSHSMATTEIRRSYHRPTSNLPAAPKPWTDPFNTERALQQYPSQLPVTHPQLPNLDTHPCRHTRSYIVATASFRTHASTSTRQRKLQGRLLRRITLSTPHVSGRNRCVSFHTDV